jgi:DNA-binding phage protein
VKGRYGCKASNFDPVDYLETEGGFAEYTNEALKENDPALLSLGIELHVSLRAKNVQ